MFVSRSIIAFFTWQVIVTALQTVAMVALLWKILGGIAQARFAWRMLRAQWRFAAGISANSLVGAIITQADKVILSGVAPLKDLGYYSVAATVAAALWFVSLPINTAVYPRLVQLLAAKDDAEVARVFHKACQAVAVPLLPAGITLALFGRAVVEVWTGNAATADQAGPIVPLIVTGTTLYGLSSVPAYLQFAAGWPRPTLYTSIVAAIVLVPATVYAVSLVGAPGAALVWLLVNVAYFVPAAFMFRRVLPGERQQWFVHDLGIPLLAATAAGVAMRLLQPAHMSRGLTAAFLAAVGAIVLAIVYSVTPEVRLIVLTRFRAWVASSSFLVVRFV